MSHGSGRIAWDPDYNRRILGRTAAAARVKPVGFERFLEATGRLGLHGLLINQAPAS